MATTAVEKVKLWLFPTLVSIIGLVIWQEIKEIKSDVKALLAQSNIDKTRIDNLERVIFNNGPLSSNTPVPDSFPLYYSHVEFILPSKNGWDDEEEG